MRTLNKERPAGDPGKYEEMRQAMKDLLHAHRFFSHLQQLGRGAGLDPKKLQQHVDFVVQTHDKSLVRAPGRGCGAGWLGRSAGS